MDTKLFFINVNKKVRLAFVFFGSGKAAQKMSQSFIHVADQ
jgi:hypothetical protein